MIFCPCCHADSTLPYAEESGYKVVRCLDCGLLYVNPRPELACIDFAVKNGEHQLGALNLNVRSRRISSKVNSYKRIFNDIFQDIWSSGRDILWVDVGSGYGEIVEAVTELASSSSAVIGVEPMKYKAEYASLHGLKIVNNYLQPEQFKADVISAIDIFSHIPDFHSFLATVASNLRGGGEVFLETGNLADLAVRSEFSGELGLPDHLVFASEKNLLRYLNHADFDVVDVKRQRVDTFEDLFKNAIKIILGRPFVLRWPYTSRYRQIRIRARLRK